MAPEQKDRFDNFQSQVLWISLACIAANFLLNTSSAKDMFSTIWPIVKQANAVIMWLTAILSGKKLIDLLEKFKKVSEEVKGKGTDEANG